MGCARRRQERGSAAADEVGSGTGRWDGEKRGDAWSAGPSARVAGRDVTGNERAGAGAGAIQSYTEERTGALPSALWGSACCPAQRKSRSESDVFWRAVEGLRTCGQARKGGDPGGTEGDFAELVSCVSKLEGRLLTADWDDDR